MRAFVMGQDRDRQPWFFSLRRLGNYVILPSLNKGGNDVL